MKQKFVTCTASYPECTVAGNNACMSNIASLMESVHYPASIKCMCQGNTPLDTRNQNFTPQCANFCPMLSRHNRFFIANDDSRHRPPTFSTPLRPPEAIRWLAADRDSLQKRQGYESLLGFLWESNAVFACYFGPSLPRGVQATEPILRGVLCSEGLLPAAAALALPLGVSWSFMLHQQNSSLEQTGLWHRCRCSALLDGSFLTDKWRAALLKRE